jgi:hypothetical protein
VSVRARVLTCEEARATINRAPLGWIEGYCSLLSALGTLHRDFYTLPDTRRLSGGDGIQAFILGLLAGLTAFRFVLQPLIVEEDLFPRRPYKALSAVDALYRKIVVLSLPLRPLPV